jgi:hypothetical protein
MTAADPAYTDLPQRSTHPVGIGGALISMVEPHPGQEQAFNRWYEDDHYYAGGLGMPWMFAGRRFVATRELQLLRYPEPSVIADPVSAGCYLHVYWLTTGHVEDHVRWTVSTNRVLRANDRIHLERTHVYTAFQDFVGSALRDARGPRDYQVLDHPYQGLVMEVIGTADGASRADLEAWIEASYIPWVHRSPDNPIGATVWFRPQPLPEDKQPDANDVPGVDRRLTLLHFLDTDPRKVWPLHFTSNGARIDTGGVGVMELAAPFLPVVFGTDKYVDELREVPATRESAGTAR